VSSEEYSTFNLEHEGRCFRNCTHSARAGEFHKAAVAGKELLLDKSGQPQENGVLLSEVVTDNDTKAANKIIETQNNIMGPVVDGKAEWYPDKSHLLKCTSNSIFEA
jgi:hypothetical protein